MLDVEELAHRFADEVEAVVRRRAAEILNERLGLAGPAIPPEPAPTPEPEAPERAPKARPRPRPGRVGISDRVRVLAAERGVPEELLDRCGSERLRLLGRVRVQAAADPTAFIQRALEHSANALRRSKALRDRLLEPPKAEPEGFAAAFEACRAGGVPATAKHLEERGQAQAKALARLVEIALTTEPEITPGQFDRVGRATLLAIGPNRLGMHGDPHGLLEEAAAVGRREFLRRMRAGEFDSPVVAA